MKAGLGWTSRDSLRNLCCALWAKSNSEREVLTSLFDQLDLPEWDLSQVTLAESEAADRASGPVETDSGLGPQTRRAAAFLPGGPTDQFVPATQPSRGLPPIDLEALAVVNRPFVFVPHFSLAPRDVTQLWRHLRDPELVGPLEELDIDATIALRCRQGLGGPIVLRPRKRKTSRLLLLVDQQGSMAPFHKLAEMICDTMKSAARPEEVAVYYFHDVPVEGADDRILESLTDRPFPTLDRVLDQVVPFAGGHVYEDPSLLSPRPLPAVLQGFAKGGQVVFLSDAGAARRRYDPKRLLDTVAFIKTLRLYTSQYVWLNPLPVPSWKGNTAEQIARYVPMFAIDRAGLQRAGSLLGSRRPVENPL
jgi:hypothetical protein